ncbi:DUF7503 family protein [Natronococcus wangiae]
MSKANPFVDYLASNPRLMGVLFTVCLLLSQAGTAAAGNGGTIS